MPGATAFYASNRPPAHKGRAQAAINSIANATLPTTARAFIRRWVLAGLRSDLAAGQFQPPDCVLRELFDVLRGKY